MKFLRPAALISTLALMCAGVRPVPREPTGEDPKRKEANFIEPEIIQGCYELGTLSWRPDLKLGEDEVFITPPRRIQILAERRSNGFEKNGYLVRAAPGIPPSIHRATYWEPTGPNTIEVIFTTGTSGLSMKLEVEGEALKGKARTHWDFLRRGQTARVIARRIDCDWRKLDAGPFSILAPSGWEFHQLKGVDSYVGEFVGDGIALTFDYGGYANPLKQQKKPEYIVVHKSIAGLRAKIITSRTPSHGVTGIYFRNVGDSNALCLFGHDLTSTQRDLVLKIFETLRFGGSVPRYVNPPPPPAKNAQ